jgi:hypothetical protein
MAQHMSVATTPMNTIWRLYDESALALRTDDVVLRDLWLPTFSSSAPSVSPFSPSVSSPATAASSAASRASAAQGVSVPVTHAAKLRHRFAAVSDTGAPCERTYHRM